MSSTAPDLYDGRTFTDLDSDVGYAEEVAFGTIIERGRLAAEGLPDGIVLRRHVARGPAGACSASSTRSGSAQALRR